MIANEDMRYNLLRREHHVEHGRCEFAEMFNLHGLQSATVGGGNYPVQYVGIINGGKAANELGSKGQSDGEEGGKGLCRLIANDAVARCKEPAQRSEERASG